MFSNVDTYMCERDLCLNTTSKQNQLSPEKVTLTQTFHRKSADSIYKPIKHESKVIISLKGIIHYLLTSKLFQTSVNFFQLFNTKADILKSVGNHKFGTGGERVNNDINLGLKSI